MSYNDNFFNKCQLSTKYNCVKVTKFLSHFKCLHIGKTKSTKQKAKFKKNKKEGKNKVAQLIMYIILRLHCFINFWFNFYGMKLSLSLPVL